MIAEVDPFDLPEWLGERPVVWRPAGGIGGHHVTGELTSDGGEPLPCDLLAVDEAYPKPVADDELRHQAHQAWRHGQVLLVDLDGRVTLAVPGTSFTADRILEVLSRLAKAVGATPGSLAALLRPGE
jgi:hypothetical protein